MCGAAMKIGGRSTTRSHDREGRHVVFPLQNVSLSQWNFSRTRSHDMGLPESLPRIRYVLSQDPLILSANGDAGTKLLGKTSRELLVRTDLFLTPINSRRHQ